VARQDWRAAVFASFLGWTLDAFDFFVVVFCLTAIAHDFGRTDRELALSITLTLAFRPVGAFVFGLLADRYGRRIPLMANLVFYSVCEVASGLAPDYRTFLVLRALFGIGMGGEWAAGMPLVLEHWPTRLRGLASGMLLGGWYWGYLFSAATFQFVYPLFSGTPDLAWRAMFWVAIVPALLTLWIRRTVKESPVWLEEHRVRDQAARGTGVPARTKLSFVRIFERDLIGTTIQTTAVIGAFMCVYYSVNYWYPTFLREAGRPTLPYLAAFNIGAIVGTAGWGRLSETALGRRGAVTITMVLGMASLPLYLHATTPAALGLGALMMGAFGMGIWGMAPAYVSERFPTFARGVGPGFTYHAGAAIGAVMPFVLGLMQDNGIRLVNAMTVAMLASGVLSAGLIWLGPETRGRSFVSGDTDVTSS